ncbi:MAG: carbonic anhydrase [Deltaproteobacteria bacterium]|nr:carbonic anhydrase [Deltaproteobacteria bacterium]
MISAHEALERLREGNRRFASGMPRRNSHLPPAERARVSKAQEPFAIVLGCSDARVPSEKVFDCELGDLFVIRVAGNIAAPSQVGSVEFAAAKFGTPLVVVLGHSNCGAILATLEELEEPTEDLSPNLNAIFQHVRPSLEALLETEPPHDSAAFVRRAVRANVGGVANHLRHASKTLEHLIQNEGFLVVGAEYSLETGAVEFFDGV